KKECFQGFEKSRRGQPRCNQKPRPGFPEGHPDSHQGLGCKILKKQKKRNAKQDRENCRESDQFEDHCFESCPQDCSEDRCQGSCCYQGSRCQGCDQACRCQAGGCGAARRGAEEGFDPASGLQDQRIRSVSRT